LEGLTVTPYIAEGSRPGVAYSLAGDWSGCSGSCGLSVELGGIRPWLRHLWVAGCRLRRCVCGANHCGSLNRPGPVAAAEAGREAAAAGCRLPGGSDDSEVLTLTCAVCQLANPLFALAGFLVLAGVMVAIRFRRPGFFERWIRCRCGHSGVAGASTGTSGQQRWTQS
jgi:hypothetical protein